MRIATTAVLLAITFVLGGMIWWMNRESSGEGSGSGSDSLSNVLVRFGEKTIDQLRILRSDGEVKLERKGPAWYLAEPESDRADPRAVSALLDMLEHLTILEKIRESEIGSSDELSAEALGFGGDQVVRIELREGEEDPNPQVVMVGNPTPIANTVYAQKLDDPDFYLVDGNPHQYLENTVATLRDPSLIRIPLDRVVQVVVKTARGDIDVRRKIIPPVTDWNLFRPLQTRASHDLLEDILTSLAGLKIESVTESGNLPGALPNPIPDGSVALELTVFGSDKPLTVFLKDVAGSPAGEVPLLEARVSDRPAVFRIRSPLKEALPESPNSFRDPHLARIPPQLVFGIGIQSRGHAPVILKTGRNTEGGVQWFSVRGEKEEPANQTRILELIQAVNDTEVLDFVSDSAARLDEFNLDPPAQKVAFSLYEIQPETAPDGAPAAGGGEVGITKRVLQLGSSEDGQTLFANFIGEPFIYEISPVFLQKLYRDPLEWKSLRVLSFNPINLRRIERIMPDEPALELSYDYRRDAWMAKMDGKEDVTSRIDKSRIAQLRDILGSLTAVDWTTSTTAFRALQTPSVTFKVHTEEIDRATGKAREVEKVVKFAPSEIGAGLFFGAFEGSPELFQIDRESYIILIAPLLSRQVSAEE